MVEDWTAFGCVTGRLSTYRHQQSWSPVEGGVSNEVFLTRTGRINVDTRGSFLTVLELK